MSVDEIAGLRERATGRVRLVAPLLAAKMVIAPKLEQFTRDYPDVDGPDTPLLRLVPR